jgi:hypothetical protein
MICIWYISIIIVIKLIFFRKFFKKVLKNVFYKVDSVDLDVLYKELYQYYLIKNWNYGISNDSEKTEWYFHAVFTAKARPFLDKGMDVSYILVFFFEKYENPRILNDLEKTSRFIGRETTTSLWFNVFWNWKLFYFLFWNLKTNQICYKSVRDFLR